MPLPADYTIAIYGLDAYPDSVTLAADTGTRQVKLVVKGDSADHDIGAASNGTR